MRTNYIHTLFSLFLSFKASILREGRKGLKSRFFVSSYHRFFSFVKSLNAFNDLYITWKKRRNFVMLKRRLGTFSNNVEILFYLL